MLPEKEVRQMLEIRSITKTFDKKTVLSDFSAAFDTGVHGISAPSGIGKTTLLRIIAGLEAPDSGSIDGVGKISMDFQEARLLPWLNVEKNASIAEKEQGIAKKILCELGLSEELSAMPSELSGGMQKRVALARGLACEFDTLLLDEPFSGLDAATADAALSTVRRHSEGKCVILVTHDSHTLTKLDSITTL